jgi:hypothetical protein
MPEWIQLAIRLFMGAMSQNQTPRAAAAKPAAEHARIMSGLRLRTKKHSRMVQMTARTSTGPPT